MEIEAEANHEIWKLYGNLMKLQNSKPTKQQKIFRFSRLTKPNKNI